MSTNGSDSWWAVQVDGTPADITSAAAATGPTRTTLEKSNRGDWLLTSERFTGLGANEVRDEAAAILADLVGAAKLSSGHVRPLRVGHLSRIHADGRRDTQVLAGSVFVPTQVFPAGVVRSHRSEGVKLASPPPLPEMAMIAGDADPDLRGALAIFARDDLGPTLLGNIFDMAEIHPNFKDWSTKTQRSRFSRSIQHPKVYGQDARHSVWNHPPPDRPMELSEAVFFIREILTRWVKDVWAEVEQSGGSSTQARYPTRTGWLRRPPGSRYFNTTEAMSASP